MKDQGTKILKYAGTAMMIWSVAELIVEILNVMHFDIEFLGEGTILGDLFMFRAGNAAVPILLSLVGLVAGAAAVLFVENDKYDKWLKIFGVSLVVIYIIEGIMLIGVQPSSWSYIRLVIVLILSAFYLYGAGKIKTA